MMTSNKNVNARKNCFVMIEALRQSGAERMGPDMAGKHTFRENSPLISVAWDSR